MAMPSGQRPTDAQTLGYSNRKAAAVKAEAQKHVANTQLLRDVLVELISCAKTNPLVGAIIALYMVDAGTRFGILSKQGSTLGFIMVGGAFGVSLADEVINDVTQIINSVSPWKQTGSQQANPAAMITPSPTTYVEASNAPPPSPWPLDDTMESVRRAYRRGTASP